MEISLNYQYENIVVIPYRNRESQLKHFIKNTIPLFKEFLPNSRVVIVEQGNHKLFNRGKLLNVGFKEYEDKAKYFITNDIDTCPKENFIKNVYAENISNNTISGIICSVCSTLGGTIKINNSDIFKINGFPNNFWGWGSEDVALNLRALFFKMNIKYGNKCNSDTYQNNKDYELFNNIKDRNKVNNNSNYSIIQNMRKQSKIKHQEFILSSGLNNLDYIILEKKEIDDYLEILIVDI